MLYNTNESDQILQKAVEEAKLSDEEFCWCGVGKLAQIKGYDRMIRIQKRLTNEGYKTHFYALGEGKQRAELESMVKELGLEESVTFLGYQTNPYKYVAKCDLFVCASHAEGFSTAAMQAVVIITAGLRNSAVGRTRFSSLRTAKNTIAASTAAATAATDRPAVTATAASLVSAETGPSDVASPAYSARRKPQ